MIAVTELGGGNSDTVDATPLDLGWGGMGGVGMITFIEVGHMVDATPLDWDGVGMITFAKLGHTVIWAFLQKPGIPLWPAWLCFVGFSRGCLWKLPTTLLFAPAFFQRLPALCFSNLPLFQRVPTLLAAAASFSETAYALLFKCILIFFHMVPTLCWLLLPLFPGGAKALLSAAVLCQCLFFKSCIFVLFCILCSKTASQAAMAPKATKVDEIEDYSFEMKGDQRYFCVHFAHGCKH